MSPWVFNMSVFWLALIPTSVFLGASVLAELIMTGVRVRVWVVVVGCCFWLLVLLVVVVGCGGDVGCGGGVVSIFMLSFLSAFFL